MAAIKTSGMNIIKATIKVPAAMPKILPSIENNMIAKINNHNSIKKR